MGGCGQAGVGIGEWMFGWMGGRNLNQGSDCGKEGGIECAQRTGWPNWFLGTDAL